MDQQVQEAIEAVRQELQRQKDLPDDNYAGEHVHPLNAMAVLRDFTEVTLTDDQMRTFLQEWDRQGRR